MHLPLDYISCVLTIASNAVIGRKIWHGWVLAGFNAVVLIAIAYKTSQFGLIPAKIFCLGLYFHNVKKWLKGDNH